MEKTAKRLLIIDDDPVLGEVVGAYLRELRLEVIQAQSGTEGLALFRAREPDLVLLDYSLPDADGVALCSEIRTLSDTVKVLFVTGYPDIRTAVAAVKAGAWDFLTKPVEPEELRLSVEKALKTIELERIADFYSYEHDRELGETVLVGMTGGLAALRRELCSAAGSDAPVLITGETGTGKNLAARMIHFRSARRKAPFICINCATLPENLVEAELFGYEKGTFTGAQSPRKGIFEMAEGGTLLLDEIGDLPTHLQSKLLGVLDDKEVRRLGGRGSRKVDVRVVAATSVDLAAARRDRRFRNDLYYRLSVLEIRMPPLRERPEDIPALCRHFIAKHPRGRNLLLPESEIEALRRYPWPGNVRELNNVIERAILLGTGNTMHPVELLEKADPLPGREPVAANTPDAILPLAEVERRHLLSTLQHYSGNLARTARALGVSLSTVKRKVRRYGTGTIGSD